MVKHAAATRKTAMALMAHAHGGVTLLREYEDGTNQAGSDYSCAIPTRCQFALVYSQTNARNAKPHAARGLRCPAARALGMRTPLISNQLLDHIQEVCVVIKGGVRRPRGESQRRIVVVVVVSIEASVIVAVVVRILHSGLAASRRPRRPARLGLGLGLEVRAGLKVGARVRVRFRVRVRIRDRDRDRRDTVRVRRTGKG